MRLSFCVYNYFAIFKFSFFSYTCEIKLKVVNFFRGIQCEYNMDVTQQKTNNLFKVVENSIEQCCAAHIIQCCQYCSALLHLTVRLNNAEQCCRRHWTILAAQHSSMPFSTTLNSLLVFCCVTGPKLTTGAWEELWRRNCTRQYFPSTSGTNSPKNQIIALRRPTS